MVREVFNRPRVTKKFFVHRNGDPAFKPVTYVFNSDKIKTFEKLLEDLERVVPPVRGGGLRSLYTLDGDFVYETLDEIVESNDTDIVACGPEGFKFGPTRMADSHNQPGLFQRPAHEEDQNPFTRGGVVRNDFNRNKNQSRIGNRVDVGQVKKVMIYRNGDPQFKNNWEKLFEDLQKVAPPVHGGPISHLYDLNGREIDDMDEIEAGRSYVAAGIEGYKNVKNGYEPSREFDLIKKGPNPELDTTDYVQQNKQKFRGIKSAAIHRRGSQIHPQNLFIYVFQNGVGLKGMRFLFTKLQLSKEMPWLLEHIGGKYKVDAKSLHTMDGKIVQSTEELIPKGAYVVVPRSEKFRDIWYYLAEGIIDTSKDSEDMKVYHEKLASRSLANSDSMSEDHWQHKRSQSADYPYTRDREDARPEVDRFSRSTRNFPQSFDGRDSPRHDRLTPPMRTMATSMTDNNLARYYSDDNVPTDGFNSRNHRRYSESRLIPASRQKHRDSDYDDKRYDLKSTDNHIESNQICEGCGRCKHCGRTDDRIPSRHGRFDDRYEDHVHMPNINGDLSRRSRDLSPVDTHSREQLRTGGDQRRYTQVTNQHRPEPIPSQNRFRLHDNHRALEPNGRNYNSTDRLSNSRSVNSRRSYNS